VKEFMCPSGVSLRVTTGPENMRGVEVGWARNGLVGRWRGRRGKGPETCTVVPASEAATECSDWAGSLFRPVYAPHIVVSCHISPDQTNPIPIPCECLRYRLLSRGETESSSSSLQFGPNIPRPIFTWP
jgi:hypothetical protein